MFISLFAQSYAIKPFISDPNIADTKNVKMSIVIVCKFRLITLDLFLYLLFGDGSKVLLTLW